VRRSTSESEFIIPEWRIVVKLGNFGLQGHDGLQIDRFVWRPRHLQGEALIIPPATVEWAVHQTCDLALCGLEDKERTNNSQKEVPGMWSSFGASIGGIVEKGLGPEGIVLAGRLVLKRKKPT
jgi:hypothetical protein